MDESSIQAKWMREMAKSMGSPIIMNIELGTKVSLVLGIFTGGEKIEWRVNA